MSNVYVVQQQPGFNMEPALKFGDLKSIFPPGIQADFDTDQFVNMARDKLKNVTKDDFLVMTGDPVLMGISFSVFSENNDGYVNCLKWDRRIGEHGGYKDISVNMEAQPN